ncbi:MAG TPA: orotidine-5'-phosphate decarboxylase [Candidatus Saccharibacteria bacterium]|nr:orotidine-5'-phosphate decarboxylase [Candidatus Saccharibacteria bacterium]
MSDFATMLAARKAEGAHLCVGLDPSPGDFDLMGVKSTQRWLESIVVAAAPYAAAWKPNLQFFLGEGSEGILMLEKLTKAVQHLYPTIPIILDAKWGDIGTTNIPDVRFAHRLGVQAVTIHNYMGAEAMRPLLEEFFCFVLCKTSNEGSGEFQDLPDGSNFLKPHHQTVAMRVDRAWSSYGPGVGLVTGATHPEELSGIDELVRDRVLLIPGVGAQGADVATVMARVTNNTPLINVSRGISGANNPAEAAAGFNNQIKEAIPR